MGTLLMCDFQQGFREPEMVKRRLVVVLSPKIQARPGLCTVVSLSTTPPNPAMPYHCQIDIRPVLPAKYVSDGVWVKGDMVYAVGFHRLDLVRTGKDIYGNRNYYFSCLSADNIKKIRECVLHGMGLSALTKHLG